MLCLDDCIFIIANHTDASSEKQSPGNEIAFGKASGKLLLQEQCVLYSVDEAPS